MSKKILAVMLSVALSVPFGTTVMAQEDNSKRIAEIDSRYRLEIHPLTGL